MADYRTMYDKESLGAWDLNGKDVTVTISEVKAGKVGHGQKASKKPIIRFKGATKSFACNVTNGKIIAGMYGNDTTKWIGKKVTLYPTQTTFGGLEVDCVRVRPQVPTGAARDKDFDAPNPEEVERMRQRQSEADAAAIAAGEDPNA